MMVSRWLLVGPAVAGALTLAGCQTSSADFQNEEAVPVTALRPQGAEATATDGSGPFPVTVARDREAALSFRVGGAIDYLPVRVGERIGAGTVLARLRGTSYSAARLQAAETAARLDRSAARAHALVGRGFVTRADDEDRRTAAAAAHAALASAAYDEASTLLRSPWGGVVLARVAEVGETVAPGQTVLRVADLGSALLARTAVPAALAARLRPGMGATVSVAGRAPLAATVRRIAAATDPATGTVVVELTLPPASGLPSGLTGSASFGVPANGIATGGTMRLPAEALLSSNGCSGELFLVDRQSRARRVRVGLAGFDGEALRVTGLPADALVITSGAGFVHDGQPVRVSRP